MEPHNKERLVGLGVLSFALAISAPWFIEQTKVVQFAQEPSWPEIKAMAPEFDDEGLSSQLQDAVAGASEPAGNSDDVQTVVRHPLPAPVQSYSVQLATFTLENKAHDLEKRLRSAGFSAYTVQTSGINGPVVKVMVGPHLNRTEAQNVQNRIETRFQMRGFVVGYDPVNA